METSSKKSFMCGELNCTTMNTQNPNGELAGSVALVTGGGQRMGLAIVDELLKNGAFVSLIDINEETGNKAIRELEIKYKSSSSRLLFVKCDVTNKIEFEDSFKKTIEKFGKINIVVNNAGIMTKYITSWELAIDLNYKAVVHGTILGLKYIENKVDRNSAVINIASIVGLSNTVLPIYQSTKRAVIDFTKCIGCPFNMKAHGNNVRVMAICPGPTFDGFDNNIDEKNSLEHEIKELIINGEETPNQNRVITIQSTDYVKTAFLHAMKNGQSGDVWITENKESARLAHFYTQY
ncbi:15-hydroxyprostaglandin dehydrogenase [NAD(+)]-like isoform X2 [Melanaphis sacchari]|nr:15-hydroxyprostaglandin dehydrogenase [NAD(+)]-like isoform X2 [Melanaphis sacchari]XP_025194197.1 15-hydroxyprostaglandin dehydrogenase [NAD(+)]-like isoform X2 [Melanaphis sacchari]XP_025194198.1 15-hydroxyprostaglandin dehydrogenase [NAD(+)]-like isoform X2 [Melanaphis sacchari]XP_025194199.1 15-hydroxyprostaglandin dehydrogenase [NAD(+)]-like isoform X2 [Melanaphis sacchari]